jgi:glycosyltransferase involved in cell wall biosynthesis
VAQSPRVGEIYRTLGVSGERMTALPFTLAHIERLRPRSFQAPPDPVTFASLNSGGHPSKGSKLIVRALRLLRAEGLEGRFNFRWLGYVDGAQAAELEAYENVELVGPYKPERLDTLLADVDVGVVPSIWEEAFGYAGLELVAKGIPLIANPIGGIVEYARDGETAWLNSSRSAEELAALMSQLVREPRLIVDMHERLMGVRDRLVTPMRGHIEAIEEIYREIVAPAEAVEAVPAP